MLTVLNSSLIVALTAIVGCIWWFGFKHATNGTDKIIGTMVALQVLFNIYYITYFLYIGFATVGGVIFSLIIEGVISIVFYILLAGLLEYIENNRS